MKKLTFYYSIPLIIILTLNSCAISFDYYFPSVEENTRDFNLYTHNYPGLIIKSPDGIINLHTNISDYITGDSEVNDNGELSYPAKKNKNQSSANSIYGGYAKYLSGTKTMKIPVELDRRTLKGWNFKIPLEVSAKNHKTKTVYAKKRLRILWTAFDIYPLFGLGLVLENGHIWRLKNKMTLELTPTESYTKYLKELSNLKIIVGGILEKNPDLKGKKTQEIWLISYEKNALAVIQLSNVYPQIIKDRDITENDVINLQKTCDALSKSDLFTSKDQAQVALDAINRKIKEDKFNDDMNLEVVCQDNSISELLNTWYIKDRVAKSVKTTMNYNNYWIPEVSYTSQKNAQKVIDEIIEAEIREEARIQKEKEDKFIAFMDTEVSCEDGATKKRRYCYILKSNQVHSVKNYFTIDNYNVNALYQKYYSSRTKAQNILTKRENEAKEAAAKARKEEEDFFKNNESQINSCVRYMYAAISKMRSARNYKEKRREATIICCADPVLGQYLPWIKNKYGDKIFNIGMQKMEEKYPELMKLYNDYRSNY